MAETLKSEQPKVAESAVAGAIATLAIWIWNTKFPDTSLWHAGDLIVGAWVTLATWFTGPLLRRYQGWAERGVAEKAQRGELAGLLDKLSKRLDAVEEK